MTAIPEYTETHRAFIKDDYDTYHDVTELWWVQELPLEDRAKVVAQDWASEHPDRTYQAFVVTIQAVSPELDSDGWWEYNGSRG